jgi:hypothetical protein
MEEEPIQKVYLKQKHPNDMKYGKRPRRRPGYCLCGNPFCYEANIEKIPSSGLVGSRKKTKGLGLKEENDIKKNNDIMIKNEVDCRYEEN